MWKLKYSSPSHIHMAIIRTLWLSWLDFCVAKGKEKWCREAVMSEVQVFAK